MLTLTRASVLSEIKIRQEGALTTGKLGGLEDKKPISWFMAPMKLSCKGEEEIFNLVSLYGEYEESLIGIQWSIIE